MNTTTTKLDKATCRTLMAEAAAALTELANRHGLTVEEAGGTIADLEATLKFKFTVNDPTATEAAARAEWNRYCGLFDLKPEDFGRTIQSHGRTFTVTGINANRDRYPIEARRDDGKKFKFPAAAIKRPTSL